MDFLEAWGHVRDTDPMAGTVSELSFVFGEEVFRFANLPL